MEGRVRGLGSFRMGIWREEKIKQLWWEKGEGCSISSGLALVPGEPLTTSL